MGKPTGCPSCSMGLKPKPHQRTNTILRDYSNAVDGGRCTLLNHTVFKPLFHHCQPFFVICLAKVTFTRYKARLALQTPKNGRDNLHAVTVCAVPGCTVPPYPNFSITPQPLRVATHCNLQLRPTESASKSISRFKSLCKRLQHKTPL